MRCSSSEDAFSRLFSHLHLVSLSPVHSLSPSVISSLLLSLRFLLWWFLSLFCVVAALLLLVLRRSCVVAAGAGACTQAIAEKLSGAFFCAARRVHVSRSSFFFFACPTLPGSESSRDGVPVVGTVPGVFMRIPHPKPLARFLGRRRGFSCGCPPQTASTAASAPVVQAAAQVTLVR